MRCKDCLAPQLLPESETAVVAYHACATQWRTGFGGRTGLDYPACLRVLRFELRDWRRKWVQAFADITIEDLFADLKVIEGAMLRADSEERERDRKEAERQRENNKWAR